ncbi:MAG TPA: hypothetical protein VIM19_03510 [Actinomycetes bacterium]
MQDFADDAVSGHRWPVLALLEAGVPVTLLADLFAAHGPDSAHIYRHEPAVDDTYWLHAQVDAVLADVATRIGSWAAPGSGSGSVPRTRQDEPSASLSGR